MRHFLLNVAAIALLTGCATSSGLAPKEDVSGFDNARRVSIPVHGAACKAMSCTGLGAAWSAENANSAIVTVGVFNQIIGITGAALNIDGKTVQLGRTRQLTAFDTSAGLKASRQDFVVPLELLREAQSAKRVWLRVYTTDGYLEDAVVDGQTDSKAHHALARFLAAVDRAAQP